MRLARELDPIEIRVLGSLLEKQQTTPDLYPLTLNSLTLACNQKSNREPVTSFTDAEVEGALERLRELVLVWKIGGSRTEKWEHNLEARWDLDATTKPLVTLLFLRGEQTAGEIRGRSDRMHTFATVDEVEETLRRMAGEAEPLLFELPKRPGQKETRWSHLVGGKPPGTAKAEPVRAMTTEDSAHARMQKLEDRVVALERELAKLKESLGA